MGTFLEKHNLPNSFKNIEINHYRRNGEHLSATQTSTDHPSPTPPPNKCTGLDCFMEDQPIFKEQIIHFYLWCYKGEEGGKPPLSLWSKCNTDGKTQQKLFPKKKTKD